MQHVGFLFAGLALTLVSACGPDTSSDESVAEAANPYALKSHDITLTDRDVSLFGGAARLEIPATWRVSEEPRFRLYITPPNAIDKFPRCGIRFVTMPTFGRNQKQLDEYVERVWQTDKEGYAIVLHNQTELLGDANVHKYGWRAGNSIFEMWGFYLVEGLSAHAVMLECVTLVAGDDAFWADADAFLNSLQIKAPSPRPAQAPP